MNVDNAYSCATRVIDCQNILTAKYTPEYGKFENLGEKIPKTNKSHHFCYLAQELGKGLKKLEAVLVDEKHEGEAFSRRDFTFVWQKRTKNQKLSKKSPFGLFLRKYFSKRPANFLVRLDMRC